MRCGDLLLMSLVSKVSKGADQWLRLTLYYPFCFCSSNRLFPMLHILFPYDRQIFGSIAND